MGQIKLVGSILLASLFAFALVSFVINYAIDNNTEVNLNNVTGFDTFTTSIQGNLLTFTSGINSSSEAFSKSTVETSSDTLKSPSVFIQMLFFIPKSIYAILNLAYSQLFGSGFEIFFTAISAFIIFIGVLYIWKTFRGDPE